MSREQHSSAILILTKKNQTTTTKKNMPINDTKLIIFLRQLADYLNVSAFGGGDLVFPNYVVCINSVEAED